MRKLVSLSAFIFLCAQINAQLGPEVTSWLIHNGEFGSYYQVGNFTPIATADTANVKNVFYNASNVYIRCGGVPAYPTAPFQDGNPSLTGDGGYTFRIPRNPVQETGTQIEPGLGQIGVFINGVPMYNYADAMSYNNMNIWHRNAVVAENDGFDCSKGHPANGHYHHHQNPNNFTNSLNVLSNVCNNYPSSGLYVLDSTAHSPLVGYAFDGFPVYGAYGFANTNGTGGIKRMESSYRKRSITQRHSLPDGTPLSVPQYGPDVSATYPLGLYKEDFEYVPGLGDLDEYNGRFCVTPEYPGGIYCYFATVDEEWNSAFPYLIGAYYYGILAADNLPSGPGPGSFGTSVVIPGGVTTYTGTLGVEEDINNLEQIRMYPNPASTYIQLDIPSELTGTLINVSITSITGQRVMNVNMNNSGQLDVTSLVDGIYMITFSYNNVTSTKRLVVVN